MNLKERRVIAIGLVIAGLLFFCGGLILESIQYNNAMTTRKQKGGSVKDNNGRKPAGERMQRKPHIEQVQSTVRRKSNVRRKKLN